MVAKRIQQLKNINPLILLIIFCITIFSSQIFFISSINKQLINIKKSQLGGDFVIKSNGQISNNQKAIINHELKQFKQSEQLIVPVTMQYYSNYRKELISLVGIDNHYPLNGTLLALTDNDTVIPVQELLTKHENSVVISDSMNFNLGLHIGSVITLQNIEATVVGIVIQEPGIHSPFESSTNKVYISMNTLKKIDMDLNDINNTFIHFYSKKNSTNIFKKYRNIVDKIDNLSTNTAQKKSNEISIQTINNMPDYLYKPLVNTLHFLSILAIAIFILIGVITAYTPKSILKPINNQKKRIIQSASLGISFGFIISQFIQLICTKVNQMPTLIMLPSIYSIITVSVLSMLFSFTIIDVINNKKKVPITLIIIIIATGSYIYLLANNFSLLNINTLVVGIGISWLVLIILNRLIKKIVYKKLNEKTNKRISLASSNALKTITILAIVFPLMYFKTILSPKETIKPSIIVFNYTQNKHTKNYINTSNLLAQQKMNISKINGQGIKKARPKLFTNKKSPAVLKQSISIQKELLASEKIIAGNWFNYENKSIECSIDTQLAKLLDIQIGNTIQLKRNPGLTITATVTSIREINWQLHQANTKIILKPTKIDHLFHNNYIGGINTANENEAIKLQAMIKNANPNIIVTNTIKESRKLNHILNFLRSIINISFFLCILFGCMVLFQKNEQIQN